jgi:hypothetical protein
LPHRNLHKNNVPHLRPTHTVERQTHRFLPDGVEPVPLDDPHKVQWRWQADVVDEDEDGENPGNRARDYSPADVSYGRERIGWEDTIRRRRRDNDLWSMWQCIGTAPNHRRSVMGATNHGTGPLTPHVDDDEWGVDVTQPARVHLATLPIVTDIHTASHNPRLVDEEWGVWNMGPGIRGIRVSRLNLSRTSRITLRTERRRRRDRSVGNVLPHSFVVDDGLCKSATKESRQCIGCRYTARRLGRMAVVDEDTTMV